MPVRKDFTHNMGEKWRGNSLPRGSYLLISTLLPLHDGRQQLISTLLTG